jgi:hypothetical protein
MRIEAVVTPEVIRYRKVVNYVLPKPVIELELTYINLYA